MATVEQKIMRVALATSVVFGAGVTGAYINQVNQPRPASFTSEGQGQGPDNKGNGLADVKPSTTPEPTATVTPVPTVVFTPAPTETPTPSATMEGQRVEVGPKLAPGITLPSEISSNLVRAFVPGVSIDGNPVPQYQDSELFLPVYNPAKAGKKDNYDGIGPWAPIAIQNIDGQAYLKTEGDKGLFDVVAEKSGLVALYFMQLGQHQHETAVNGNNESNPTWRNQYTLHLKPGQQVWVIDGNGNQVLWKDGHSPMILAASNEGDFSIEVPQTPTNEDVVFGLVIKINASDAGIQATATKVQRGPNDHPGLTGENKFDSAGVQAITMPALPEK